MIKEPIDLKMIAKKVQDCEYKTLEDMDRDVSLMMSNAKTFNEPKSLIYKVSRKMMRLNVRNLDIFSRFLGGI